MGGIKQTKTLGAVLYSAHTHTHTRSPSIDTK